MFYLLEDNRIFDSENLREDLSSGKPLAMEFDISKKRNEIHFYFLGIHFEALKIKKQSENVFDLIEKGDLVRYLNNIYEIKNIYYIDDGVVDFVTSNCGICFPSWKNFLKGFNTIYKPNSKGDYIKVWEKKDD